MRHDHTPVPSPYKKQNNHQKENEYRGVFQEANFREAVDQSSAAGWSPFLLRQTFLVAASIAVFPQVCF